MSAVASAVAGAAVARVIVARVTVARDGAGAAAGVRGGRTRERRAARSGAEWRATSVVADERPARWWPTSGPGDGRPAARPWGSALARGERLDLSIPMRVLSEGGATPCSGGGVGPLGLGRTRRVGTPGVRSSANGRRGGVMADACLGAGQAARAHLGVAGSRHAVVERGRICARPVAVENRQQMICHNRNHYALALTRTIREGLGLGLIFVSRLCPHI